MMYVWFLEDQARLIRELMAIEELAASADWLIGTSWVIENGLLCIDAVICVHDNDYHVRMEYPRYFPSVPPIVCPTKAQFRWTAHQYGGINGPLCLQWGPDNWQPDVTGAQMLESAYTLFYLENPLGTEIAERPQPAPSRHSLTLGQELRSAWCRFYVGRKLLYYLASLPEHTYGVIQFSNHSRAATWFTLIHSMQPAETPEAQVDDTIPRSMHGPEGDNSLVTGAFFKTLLESNTLNHISRTDDLKAALWQLGHDVRIFEEEVGPNSLGLTVRPFGVLVLDKLNTPHFFFLLADGKAVKANPVPITSPTESRRLPQGLEELSRKSIGIVGLGSAGSKIALALARMGVRSFYLVDYDVLLPENVARHVLDWSSVGEHKVDGVRELLSRISANMEVTVSKIHLTGQESPAVVSGELRKLSQCDLLVDASANPEVLNLLAAVTTAAKKPLVWLEVFGGGNGGFVARSRPGRDLAPYIMRDAYNRFCADNPAPEDSVIYDYTTEDTEGRVMVGSDAAVGIIANYAVQLAVDTVLGRDPSAYPYSMYLIGLARWWVFTAPFHNIPIDTHHLSHEQGKLKVSPEDSEKAVQFIIDLLKKQSDADSSSA